MVTLELVAPTERYRTGAKNIVAGWWMSPTDENYGLDKLRYIMIYHDILVGG